MAGSTFPSICSLTFDKTIFLLSIICVFSCSFNDIGNYIEIILSSPKYLPTWNLHVVCCIFWGIFWSVYVAGVSQQAERVFEFLVGFGSLEYIPLSNYTLHVSTVLVASYISPLKPIVRLSRSSKFFDAWASKYRKPILGMHNIFPGI